MADEPSATASPEATPSPTTQPPASTKPPSPTTEPAKEPAGYDPKPSLLEGDEPKAEGEPKEEPKEPAKTPDVDIDVAALKVEGLPEGVTLAPEALQEVADVAKEHKLSQDVAQSLLNRHIAALKKTHESLAQAQVSAWEKTQNEWQAAVKADNEIGGDKLQTVTSTVSKVLQEFGDPDVRKALSFTGAGNHPAVIRTLYRMSKALTEGGHVQGSPPKPTPGVSASALYPTLPAS